jgi:hypothetical protein
MVESIYFLKPAWCGTHFAGLWPEQGLQPVTGATALRRWSVTHVGRVQQKLISYTQQAVACSCPTCRVEERSAVCTN